LIVQLSRLPHNRTGGHDCTDDLRSGQANVTVGLAGFAELRAGGDAGSPFHTCRAAVPEVIGHGSAKDHPARHDPHECSVVFPGLILNAVEKMVDAPALLKAATLSMGSPFMVDHLIA
jgi:hypothetical protein